MSKEYFVGVYPGRIDEKSSECCLEMVAIEREAKKGYIMRFARDLSQSGYGYIYDSLAREINNICPKNPIDKSYSIIDQTHCGGMVMSSFKGLTPASHGIILTDKDLVEYRDGTFLVPKRDVIMNLLNMMDAHRFDFEKFSISGEWFRTFKDGTRDFVKRNIDAKIEHVLKRS